MKGEKRKGGIRPLEMEIFKKNTQIMDKLICPKPRRKNDDVPEKIQMQVIGKYPHVVTLSYHDRSGKQWATSMTWAEAILLNRMTQKELEVEIRRMQSEFRKAARMERNNNVIGFRRSGMTYQEIAARTGYSYSTIRNICTKEVV